LSKRYGKGVLGIDSERCQVACYLSYLTSLTSGTLYSMPTDRSGLEAFNFPRIRHLPTTMLPSFRTVSSFETMGNDSSHSAAIQFQVVWVEALAMKFQDPGAVALSRQFLAPQTRGVICCLVQLRILQERTSPPRACSQRNLPLIHLLLALDPVLPSSCP
jgi:hypothetical protein